MKYLQLYFLVFFYACSANKGTIKVKGSDTEVNRAVLLAESFHEKDDSLLISVSGGGSGPRYSIVT